MTSESLSELHPAVRHQVRAELRRRGLVPRHVRVDSPTRAVISRPGMAQSPPVVQQPSETQPGERVNTFGAAQILGCSTSKVRKLVAAGKLPKPSIVEPGHTRMHSRSALDAYSAEADGPEAAHAGAGAEPVGM